MVKCDHACFDVSVCTEFNIYAAQFLSKRLLSGDQQLPIMSFYEASFTNNFKTCDES